MSQKFSFILDVPSKGADEFCEQDFHCVSMCPTIEAETLYVISAALRSFDWKD